MQRAEFRGAKAFSGSGEVGLAHCGLAANASARLAVGMRILPWFCAALLAALGVLRGAEPVRIGLFMSITGRDASFGEASLRGARLAVEQVNAAGGVLGRQLELVVEDNRSVAGESATAAKKLITRDRVVALETREKAEFYCHRLQEFGLKSTLEAATA